MLRAPEFTAFLPPQTPWRAARQWLAISAMVPAPQTSDSPVDPRSAQDAQPARDMAAVGHAIPARATRFGITVSRRQARRAVARNAVKRVLREAARHQAPALDAALAGVSLDILFRLKSPLPDAATAPWATVKAQLRREADSLLTQLLERLHRGALPPAVRAPVTRPHSLAQSAGDCATPRVAGRA